MLTYPINDAVHEKFLAGILPKAVTRKVTKKPEQIHYDNTYLIITI